MRKTVLILGHNDATQFIDIYNQYTRLFDENKYEVTVAYLTGKPSEAVRMRTLAENVLFLNYSQRRIRGLKLLPIFYLLKLVFTKRYEFVICHRYKPTYIMGWVAQFVRIPHLIGVMHELKTSTSFGRRLLLTYFARRGMILAGVSNAVRDDLRASLPRISKERIITLYNMLDVDLTLPELMTREEARTALNLPADAFVYGNIARLAENKDHVNLFKAFAQIKTSNAKLVILGDGILEERLKALVTQMGLQDRVIFAGFVPNAYRYMLAFDCFVLSSLQEAFGRVLLEAMIAKLPVIATSVNGIPEVVGDSGYLIPAKNPNLLANKMQQILDFTPEQRAELGEKAYERVIAQFSIPAFQKLFWETLPT